MKITDFSNIWGRGQLFCFSGVDGQTDFENGIVLRSGETALLKIKHPGESGQIILAYGKPDSCYLSSDWFRVNETTGILADAHHLLIEGSAELHEIPDTFTILRKENRILLGVKRFFRPEFIELDIASELEKRFRFFEGLAGFGIKDEFVSKALVKAVSQMKGQIYAPYEGFPFHWSTPDRWPHRNMWLWDSVFHAIGLRHLDLVLAKEILMAVLASQCADGMVPHMMLPKNHSDITQPPILAFGVKLLNDMQPDLEFLRNSYSSLKRYLEWIMQNRDTDGNGLVEWKISGNPFCRSGESGMDNSSRFDSATQLDATDFNAYLSLECECMAEFAEILGIPEKAYWQTHHERLNRLMNELLWSETERIYMDRDVCTGRHSGIVASAGFLPLICGAPSPEQASAMLSNLNDPETFGTPLRVPSISRKCEKAYQKDMWRGPVWININWLIAYGLERYGMKLEADKLLRETAAIEEKYYRKYGTFFEFYDDRDECDPPQLLRKGKCDPSALGHQVFHDYGWSATLYIDIARKIYRK